MEPKFPNVTVKLVDEDGNAFAIISRVSKALRQAGCSTEEVLEYQTEAIGGDYDNLIQVTMRWVNVE